MGIGESKEAYNILQQSRHKKTPTVLVDGTELLLHNCVARQLALGTSYGVQMIAVTPEHHEQHKRDSDSIHDDAQ